ALPPDRGGPPGPAGPACALDGARAGGRRRRGSARAGRSGRGDDRGVAGVYRDRWGAARRASGAAGGSWLAVAAGRGAGNGARRTVEPAGARGARGDSRALGAAGGDDCRGSGAEAARTSAQRVAADRGGVAGVRGAEGPRAPWLVWRAQRTPHPTASRPPSPLKGRRGEGVMAVALFTSPSGER